MRFEFLFLSFFPLLLLLNCFPWCLFSQFWFPNKAREKKNAVLVFSVRCFQVTNLLKLNVYFSTFPSCSRLCFLYGIHSCSIYCVFFFFFPPLLYPTNRTIETGSKEKIMKTKNYCFRISLR